MKTRNLFRRGRKPDFRLSKGKPVALLAVLGLLAAACGNGEVSDSTVGGALDDATTTTSESNDATTTSPGDGETITSEAPGEAELFYGAPTEEMVAAAQEDGQLTLYVSDTLSVVEAQADAFTERFGITVDILRLTSSDLMTRFAEETSAGTSPADYLRIGDVTLFEQEADWFLPVEELDLPVFALYEDHPDVFVDRYVNISATIRAINYNRDLTTDDVLPETWTDVLDPAWQDRVVVSNPLASASQLGWAAEMRTAHGDDFLEQLAAQNPEWVDSGVGGAQLIATGAYALSFPVNPSHAAEVIESGAPIGHIFPTNPTVLNPDSHGIPVAAPNPDAARLWLNWRMSPEAVQISCELVAGTGGVIGGIEGCIDIPYDDAVVPSENFTEEEANPILELLGLR